MSKKHTYKSAGVDVDAGNRFVTSISDLVARTHRPEVLTSIGGFGGLFQPDFSTMKQPVLVSSVDGVGTKLIIAFRTGVYDTVGQCLVNHCVNDIAVCGAEPLFFLDYFSTGKLEQEVAYDVLKGFSIACEQNGCALIGGETAEMPDIYGEGEFDLAGTVVGVVDRDDILDGSGIRDGDVILGVTGNGLHTNGYSLARKVLLSKYSVDQHLSELGMTIGEALLQIHPSYLRVIRELKKMEGVRGFAHITGGGIVGNTERIVAKEKTLKGNAPKEKNADEKNPLEIKTGIKAENKTGLKAEKMGAEEIKTDEKAPGGLMPVIDWDSWEWPAIFELIRKEGNVPVEDMRQAFNLGIGLTVVVSPENVDSVLNTEVQDGFRILPIGEIRTSR